jgi:hypothetical protein
MYIPKKYGAYRKDCCPFCGRQAVTENSQGVPVCIGHKNKNLPDMKCACGEYLDVCKGKWGPYFRCMNCGNISFSKALEMNPSLEDKEEKKKEQEKRHRVVTSDEVDLHFS